MAASANIDLNFSATYTKPATLATASTSPKIVYSDSLSSSDISKVYYNTATISGVTTLDVTSLTDVYGAALSFGTVKGVCLSVSGANLVVGGGSNPLFGTDQYTIQNGYMIPILSPVTVSGSVKAITLTPSASLTYSVVILGS